MAERWNPWRALRHRHTLDFVRAPLPHRLGGALYWPELDGAVIVLDPVLTRVQARCALAHELVHHERGGGSVVDDPVLERREDRRVDREVSRRLVPLDELDEWVRRRVDADLPVTAAEVAEEWDVVEPVAELALHLLAQP